MFSRQVVSMVAAILVASGVWGSAAASASRSPGALPRHNFAYADSYRGWPVAPTHRQHPIRGGFLDPRYPERVYHWGIDVNVRDDRPERGAPPGRTHRVYAVEGGVVRYARDGGTPCLHRRVELGHFSYWHVDPTVRAGQAVHAGQMIGWTCQGAWHVHLGEWAVVRGYRVWVNPLHRGGKIAPYADTAAPLAPAISFYAPADPPAFGTRLDPNRLAGVVDARASVSDPQSFRGWMVGPLEALHADHHPYELRVRMTRLRTGRTWTWTVFRSDIWLGEQAPPFGTPLPFTHHFAQGTDGKPKTPDCLRRRAAARTNPPSCDGDYAFHLFGTQRGRFWDTRLVPNGRYRFAVTAIDVRGNRTSATAEATVAN
ncbi:MAG TPA: hypothetical protein VHF67_03605 [Gaiellaceae bacterium]|nr:hypothetical protein [Gaiellaceae bacterium]